MSLYGDDVSFNEKTAERENKRQGKLEWKAQFHRIDDIIDKKRDKRFTDKIHKRDKSSDHHLIHSELLNTINERATSVELAVITKLSFWEKVGLSKLSSNKKEMMLNKGK